MLDRLTIERMEAGEEPILVALSGGGDSVALLHLLTEHFGAKRLHAAVVDHKLRDGSADEARRAVDIATSIGVSARTYPLTWPNAGSRGHNAARAHRYAVLCDVARDCGAKVVATGHTRDDQAETVFMRGSRGSGMRGLAGMCTFGPPPGWPSGRGLRLARPLLGVRRTPLRDYLRERGVGWIEDPSNDKDVYARVRARQALTEMEREGLDPMRLAAVAERLRPLMDEIDKAASALILDAATLEDDEIKLDRARWSGASAVKQRALEVLIMAASGEERGPALAQLENLSDALSSDFTGATLGGAWLQQRGARIVIRRDPGALAGRADGALPKGPWPLAAGEETVCDGRLALTVNEAGWCVAFDGPAPILVKGDTRAPLASADARWLLRARVEHLLDGN